MGWCHLVHLTRVVTDSFQTLQRRNFSPVSLFFILFILCLMLIVFLILSLLYSFSHLLNIHDCSFNSSFSSFTCMRLAQSVSKYCFSHVCIPHVLICSVLLLFKYRFLTFSGWSFSLGYDLFVSFYFNLSFNFQNLLALFFNSIFILV